MESISNNEAAVLKATRKLTELMIAADILALDQILDAYFTLTHITGYVQSKAEWLSEIASEEMKYYSYQQVRTSIEIKGSSATVIGQNLLDARIWGMRNTA